MGDGDQDLKIEAAAIARGVRDLKIESAAIGGGLKMNKDAVTSEGVDTLKMNGGMFNLVASEAADGRDLEMKEATRPEVEGGILRLKKEADAACDLWFQTRRRIRKVSTQWKAQAPPGAGNKRKKVVKIKLRKDYVDYMEACPFSICADFSEEQLARYNPEFSEIYAAAKFLEAKNRAYWNALIAQQKEFGYAEDENEVTDDEEEEAVVKN